MDGRHRTCTVCGKMNITSDMPDFRHRELNRPGCLTTNHRECAMSGQDNSNLAMRHVCWLKIGQHLWTLRSALLPPLVFAHVVGLCTSPKKSYFPPLWVMFDQGGKKGTKKYHLSQVKMGDKRPRLRLVIDWINTPEALIASCGLVGKKGAGGLTWKFLLVFLKVSMGAWKPKAIKVLYYLNYTDTRRVASSPKLHTNINSHFLQTPSYPHTHSHKNWKKKKTCFPLKLGFRAVKVELFMVCTTFHPWNIHSIPDSPPPSSFCRCLTDIKSHLQSNCAQRLSLTDK